MFLFLFYIFLYLFLGILEGIFSLLFTLIGISFAVSNNNLLGRRRILDSLRNCR